MYLTDLTFIEDGNSDYIATANGGSSQLINFVKRKQVSNVIGEIQQYQHAPYCLEPVDFIIDWLLQVETLSEDECYKLSLVREPKGSKMGLDKSSSGTLRKRTSTLSRQASSPFKKGSLASSLGGSQSPSSSDKNAPASSGSLFSSPYGDLEEIKGYKFYEKDSSKNIIIEDYEDRVVIKAGNIYKLVERLTFEKYPDPNYLGLYSFSSFSSFPSPSFTSPPFPFFSLLFPLPPLPFPTFPSSLFPSSPFPLLLPLIPFPSLFSLLPLLFLLLPFLPYLFVIPSHSSLAHFSLIHF